MTTETNTTATATDIETITETGIVVETDPFDFDLFPAKPLTPAEVVEKARMEREFRLASQSALRNGHHWNSKVKV